MVNIKILDMGGHSLYGHLKDTVIKTQDKRWAKAFNTAQTITHWLNINTKVVWDEERLEAILMITA